jgi:hypothetical protein
MCGSAARTPTAACTRARARAAARARLCASSGVCTSLGSHVSDIQRSIYMATSVITASLLCHARGCMSVPHPCIPTCPCARGLTARRCASCARVRFPLLTAMDRHAGMGRYLYTFHTHALPCTPIIVRACRRGGHAPRTRRGVRAHARALVCVRGRARIRANAFEHFTPPPSVAFSARRRSSRRRPSTRTSARGTPLPSRACSRYAPLPARRAPQRTALGRSPTHARPLCAAAPPMCLCVRM